MRGVKVSNASRAIAHGAITTTGRLTSSHPHLTGQQQILLGLEPPPLVVDTVALAAEQAIGGPVLGEIKAGVVQGKLFGQGSHEGFKVGPSGSSLKSSIPAMPIVTRARTPREDTHLSMLVHPILGRIILVLLLVLLFLERNMIY